MSKDELQPFISLGPFLGMNTADAQPFVPPGYSVLAKNANTYRHKGALMPERGRVSLNDFGPFLARIDTMSAVVAPAVGFPFGNPHNQLLIQGVDVSNNLVTLIHDIPNSTTFVVANALKYTQAVQYASVVYTNAGQRFFVDTRFSDPSYPQFYTWQYTGFAPTVVLSTSPVGGNIPEETRFYVYTQVTTMPDGTVSETSPENFATPDQITTAAGVTNSITLTPAAPPNGFDGFNKGPNGQTLVGIDGTKYNTNIYAQSSLQAGYFLVGTTDGTNSPFIDTLSDEQLAEQPPLLVVNGSAFQRDPPPVGPFQNPVAPFSVIYNRPFLAVYQNCMFVFTHIDNIIVGGSAPSTQAWYSLPGKPWEFSSDTRALLLNNNVEMPMNASSDEFDYNANTGDYAKALGFAGSYLFCAKRRETWLIYGNGTDASPFTQQQVLNVGTQSIRSVTSAVGGCFFMSENGLYFFDGQSPQYEESKFRFVNTDFLTVSDNDNIHCVGAFSNLTFYLFYPTLGKGYSYNTVTGEWMSELEYGPFSEDAIFSTPADASIDPIVNPTGNLINQVVAARFGLPAAVDYLFADQVNDLGSPQIIEWQGPENDGPGTDFKKEFSCMTVFAPKQAGILNVQVTVDGNLAINRSFDLSAQRPLIANFTAQGFSANIHATLQSVGTVVPEVWKIQVWGSNLPMRRLGTPQ
jgi:hypothetical protein